MTEERTGGGDVEEEVGYVVASGPPLPASVSADQRRAALQARINTYVGQQYRVVSQTDYSAQLVKPKRFSFVWFLVWVLTVGGWPFYLLYHIFLKRERQAYLVVDESGRVQETKDKR